MTRVLRGATEDGHARMLLRALSLRVPDTGQQGGELGGSLESEACSWRNPGRKTAGRHGSSVEVARQGSCLESGIRVLDLGFRKQVL